MAEILICWLGATDLKAASLNQKVGLGPIGQTAIARSFDEITLISDYGKDRTSPYITWLQEKSPSKITVHYESLSSPTNFGEIYQTATCIVSNKITEYGPSVSLSFHLSPGTPAMAAVWIILAKTRFPAELIESSLEHGVRTASVPFDMSAEFIPDLLRGPDSRLEKLAAELPPEAPEFESIIHKSHIMSRVITKARHISPRSVPVLIEGETGTGKELLARAIHEASPRKGKPFLAVNCGAVPSELIESELFGYEKGAFTGAEKQKPGYFETTDTGTLFLDEIGELPLSAQAKILRALQEKEITRLGATRPITFDVRIMAATNRNLIDEVASGRFRSDLFYRIAVAVLKLPPLRERSGDISLLIDRLLNQINQESVDEPGYKYKKISAAAKNLMIQHTWPGNVRELQNTLRRAAIWSVGPTIDAQDISEAMLPIINANNDKLLGRPMDEGVNLLQLIEKLSQHYLKRALDKAGGNKTKAAKLVGLPNYQTFSNWLKKYGLE